MGELLGRGAILSVWSFMVLWAFSSSAFSSSACIGVARWPRRRGVKSEEPGTGMHAGTQPGGVVLGHTTARVRPVEIKRRLFICEPPLCRSSALAVVTYHL